MELSENDLQTLASASLADRTKTLLSQSGSSCGNIDSVPIAVTQASSCRQASWAPLNNSSSPSTLAVVFQVNTLQCNLWWIILAAAGGGVVLIAVVVVALLSIFNKRFRNFVRPHASKKGQAEPSD